MQQIMDEIRQQGVESDHILNINFEFVKDEKMYYVFLDEIQNVDEFEKVLNSLRASVNKRWTGKLLASGIFTA